MTLGNRIKKNDIDPSYKPEIARAVTLKGYWIIVERVLFTTTYEIRTNDADYWQLTPLENGTKNECTNLLRDFAKKYRLPFVYNGALEDYRERISDNES